MQSYFHEKQAKKMKIHCNLRRYTAAELFSANFKNFVMSSMTFCASLPPANSMAGLLLISSRTDGNLSSAAASRLSARLFTDGSSTLPP